MAPFGSVVDITLLFFKVSFLLICSPNVFLATAGTSVRNVFVEELCGEATALHLLVWIGWQGAFRDLYTPYDPPRLLNP